MAVPMNDLRPDPLPTPTGPVAFEEETWTIDPRELQTFFQAEGVFWTADRTLEQWRRLLACSRLLTARLRPDPSRGGGRGGRLVGTLRLWSDGAYEAKLYDVVTARDMMNRGVATALARWALRHPATAGVQRFVLETRDAGHLYEKLGFADAQAHETVHMRARVGDLQARGLR